MAAVLMRSRSSSKRAALTTRAADDGHRGALEPSPNTPRAHTSPDTDAPPRSARTIAKPARPAAGSKAAPHHQPNQKTAYTTPLSRDPLFLQHPLVVRVRSLRSSSLHRRVAPTVSLAERRQMFENWSARNAPSLLRRSAVGRKMGAPRAREGKPSRPTQKRTVSPLRCAFFFHLHVVLC